MPEKERGDAAIGSFKEMLKRGVGLRLVQVEPLVGGHSGRPELLDAAGRRRKTRRRAFGLWTLPPHARFSLPFSSPALPHATPPLSSPPPCPPTPSFRRQPCGRAMQTNWPQEVVRALWAHKLRAFRSPLSPTCTHMRTQTIMRYPSPPPPPINQRWSLPGDVIHGVILGVNCRRRSVP